MYLPHQKNTEEKPYDNFNSEKAFNKSQHPFIIKTFNKLEIKSNLIKGIYEKPSANFVLSDKILKVPPQA